LLNDNVGVTEALGDTLAVPVEEGVVETEAVAVVDNEADVEAELEKTEAEAELEGEGEAEEAEVEALIEGDKLVDGEAVGLTDEEGIKEGVGDADDDALSVLETEAELL